MYGRGGGEELCVNQSPVCSARGLTSEKALQRGGSEIRRGGMLAHSSRRGRAPSQLLRPMLPNTKTDARQAAHERHQQDPCDFEAFESAPPGEAPPGAFAPTAALVHPDPIPPAGGLHAQSRTTHRFELLLQRAQVSDGQRGQRHLAVFA